jgi:hypothetical protein
MKCQDGGLFDVGSLSIDLRGRNKLCRSPIITLFESRFRIKFEGRAKKLYSYEFTTVYYPVISVDENCGRYSRQQNESKIPLLLQNNGDDHN